MSNITIEKIKLDKMELFLNILQDFIHDCNVHTEYLDSALRKTEADADISALTIEKYLKEHNLDNGNELPEKFHSVIYKNAVRLRVILSRFSIIPKSVLLSLISSYDAFFSSLIKQVISSKEDLLYLIKDEKISVSDIYFCNDKNEINEVFISKKVDCLMRESFSAQVDWIEKSFNLKIKKGFKRFNELVFLTQVRNIYAHNNGVVNSIFLENVGKEANKQKLQKGKLFILTPEFLYNSIDLLIHFCLFIYSKILKENFKKDADKFDHHINSICYTYLVQEKYKLAISILNERFKSEEKLSSEASFYFVCNLCIAYKLSGDETNCKKYLDELDWSNCDNKFKLARAVLLEQYSEAALLMKKENKEEAYDTYFSWPLYLKFRESEEFKTVFKEIYGEEFDNKELDFDVKDIIKQAEETIKTIHRSNVIKEKLTPQSNQAVELISEKEQR